MFRHDPIQLGSAILSIEANSEALLERCADLLGDLPAADEPADSMAVLCVESDQPDAMVLEDPARFAATLDGRTLCVNADRQVFEERVTRALNRLHLDEQPEYLHLHAGAATRDGATVLIIGPTHAGKSTLVAKLVALGWSYLSDEQVGVTTDGSLIAYQRPLSLRRNSWGFFDGVPGVPDPATAPVQIDRVELVPRDIGPVYHGPPLAPTIVVCPDVSEADAETTPLNVAATMSLLVADSLDLERSGDRGVASMLALVSAAPGYRIEGQDLAYTCESIASLCADATAPGAVLSSDAVDDRSANRVPATLSWLFADRSAAVYEPASGVFAVIDEVGYQAWLTMADPVETWPDELASSAFVTELAGAGLLQA